MADSPAGERTEQATPRRRERARQEGRVARSPDLAGATSLVFGLVGLSALGWSILAGLGRVMTSSLGGAGTIGLDPSTVCSIAVALAGQVAVMVLPLACLMGTAGVIVNVLQGGLFFSWQSVAPKWERVDPVAGLGRLFSARTLVALLVITAKVGAVLGCGYLALLAEWEGLSQLIGAPPQGVLFRVAGLVAKTAWWTAVAFLVAGGIDYAYKRWSFDKSLRMTKQEAREEHKELEGDPHIKAKIRGIQRQMAMRRMMREVPKSDVVITNPTHVAVALRYDAGSMTAPRLVAKGKRKIARRIRQIAEREGVPVVEQPPLARAIEKVVPVGSEIPERFYRAIAEVLSQLYRLGLLSWPKAIAPGSVASATMPGAVMRRTM